MQRKKILVTALFVLFVLLSSHWFYGAERMVDNIDANWYAVTPDINYLAILEFRITAFIKIILFGIFLSGAYFILPHTNSKN